MPTLLKTTDFTATIRCETKTRDENFNKYRRDALKNKQWYGELPERGRFSHTEVRSQKSRESHRVIQRVRRLRQRNHPDFAFTSHGFTQGCEKQRRHALFQSSARSTIREVFISPTGNQAEGTPGWREVSKRRFICSARKMKMGIKKEQERLEADDEVVIEKCFSRLVVQNTSENFLSHLLHFFLLSLD